MTTAENQIGKRPRLVWAILIWYLAALVSSSLSITAVYSGSLDLPPEKVAYFARLTPADHLITVMVAVLNASGAIALFMFRRMSFNLLSTAFTLNVLAAFLQLVRSGLSGALSAGGVIGLLIGYGVTLSVCVYAWKLKKDGVLR